MKRYFTVKEASKLLGVSTNTVYKYLSEGKLISKRFGRGRFKILYSSLAPYIDTTTIGIPTRRPDIATPQETVIKYQNIPEPVVTQVDQAEEIPEVTSEKVTGTLKSEIQDTLQDISQKVQVAEELTKQVQAKEPDLVDDSEYIANNINDYLFVRIFKGVYLLGLGLVYIFTKTRQFSEISLFSNAVAKTLIILLPYFLILSGILVLSAVYWNARNRTWDYVIHLLVILSSALISLLAYFSQDFGLFVFTAAFLFISVGHIIRGLSAHNDFLIGYTTYLLLLILLSGMVIFRFPDLVPYSNFEKIINKHLGYALIIWFGLILPYFIFILTKYGRSFKFNALVFFLVSFVSVFMSIGLTLISAWDVAYLSFLTGIFAAILGIWKLSNFRLAQRNIYIIVIAAVWVSSSILFGLFSINNTQKQVRKDALIRVQTGVNSATTWVNEYFEKQKSVITSFSGNQDIIAVIESKNSEQAISKSKEIYDKLENVERVLIYTKEGTAIGVYPRNSMAQGTNFSSREYFQKTANSYRGYLSDVFENILGTKTVIQTEPIFENNELVGIIGVATSLDDIKKAFSAQFSGLNNFDVFDSKGSLVFASHYDTTLNNQQELDKRFNEYNSEFFRVKQDIKNPGWRVYFETPVSPLLADVSDINTTISVLLLVNALFTFGIALVLSSSSKKILSKPNVEIPLDAQGVQTSIV